MITLDNEILKNLHFTLIEILDEFVKICNENNLTYFLTAGTLLGAVRHKGFIPWDDDIDIAMPRSDYNKFLALHKNHINSKFYIYSRKFPVDTENHYKKYFKFCKKGTLFAREDWLQENWSGIWIDVWPFDDSITILSSFHALLIKISWIFYYILTQGNKGKNYLYFLLHYIFRNLIPLKYIFNIINFTSNIFCNLNTSNITFYHTLYGFKKETYRKNWVFPLVNITFEGKKYKAPFDYDKFLKHLYGNYLKLPPVNEQKSHLPKYIKFEDHNI